jgi:hypothetical protein
VRRLVEAQRELVRPDAMLWWGVGVLVAFAIVGVGMPLWLMSDGPGSLGQVRWVVYPFGAALASLLGYIVVYLVGLTRRRETAPMAASARSLDGAPSDPSDADAPSDAQAPSDYEAPPDPVSG